MALVKPAKPRALVNTTAAGLEIVIPARRNWFLVLFLGAWLGGWAIGAAMVPMSLFSGTADPGGTAFLLVTLTLFALVLFRNSLVAILGVVGLYHISNLLFDFSIQPQEKQERHKIFQMHGL